MSEIDFTDTTRNYRTRSGERVTIHQIVRKNAIGEDATFPLKGSIKDMDRPRRPSRYCIFTLEGRTRVLSEHKDDLVGLWEEDERNAAE